jgi:ATP-dependent DNA helicase RecQ
MIDTLLSTFGQQAIYLLKEAYGAEAEFRAGQLEAIEATLHNRRTLIVQKTGWGKSIIYFITARILRQNGKGPTIVISPLLELMNNQIEAAKRFGLRCGVLNSTVNDAHDRSEILKDLQTGNIDVFFTTPETLFRDETQRVIPNVSIGLFVVDEAHCLSDWGHDFRREYSRLYRIIDSLPTAPVLCTTATANDRVIADLKRHLGKNVFISRGDLMRESLYLQVVRLQNKAERYAWILDHIGELPGTGIIYCLTKRECDHLRKFLTDNGVSAEAYYSDSNREFSGLNATVIKKFKNNKIKAIVATIKLGMGYDKPDIGFVIHFQRPQNVVAYYQQIGRAGRNIDKAYAILMSGPEDDDILNYFIDNAFPSEKLCASVLSAADGKSRNELQSAINERKSRINNAIELLEFDGYLRKEERKYYRVPKAFTYDKEHYDEITAIRHQELEQMRGLITTESCLLRYAVDCLNNPTSEDCNRCANCAGTPLIDSSYSKASLVRAQTFIKSLILDIEPRKMWAATDMTRVSRIPFPLRPGICLSKYGDVGYGEMVRHDKYHTCDYRDELLVKSKEVLRSIVEEQGIRMLTYVPSLRNDKAKKFSEKLAKALGLKFFDIIEKVDAPQQKVMENSSFQCQNALHSFSISTGLEIPYPSLLVDDIVDSRWTLTVCGNLLGEHGCDCVVPFCLADSSERGTNG